MEEKHTQGEADTSPNPPVRRVALADDLDRLDSRLAGLRRQHEEEQAAEDKADKGQKRLKL